MLVLKVPQDKVHEHVQQVSGDHTEIYLNRRPSLRVIRTLLTNCPNLKTLYVPPSLHEQTARKAFDVLGEAAVELKPHCFGIGRPPKHAASVRDKVVQMRGQGVPVTQIAQNLKIPLRTAYYFLEKASQAQK